MQTTIQRNSAIRTGSVKLEVGDSLLALVNIGALRGVSWGQKGTTDEIKFDNTASIKKYSDGDKFSIKATLCEIFWDNIKHLNDGQVVVTNVAGSLQTVVGEAKGTGWTLGQPIRATYKNGDNTAVGSLVVKQGSTTLTLNTDYRVYVGDGSNGTLGYTYVVPLVAYATAITFGYTYTPTASKVITFNSSGTKTTKYIRITNTDSNGLTQVFTLSGATNIAPIEISFASDSEANVSEMPIELEGYMVNVTDEQSTV